MSAVVLRGDARALPLPDECVDLIVTSPPFWALRSYTDGGIHYDGQIGSEPAPREYIDSLLACTREWVRVLKPSGSLFVELGDKYGASGHGPSRGNGTGRGPQGTALRQTRGPMEKSLLDLPHRYVIRCMDELGLILRAEIVWHHANGLPESVTDRVRRAHSAVFHLVRQPRYYAAVDAIREPHTGGTHARRKDGRHSPKEQATIENGFRRGYFPENLENPLGKLPGSVWDIHEGESTIRLILQAVAADALTIDEAERLMKGIQWTGSNGSTPASNAPTAAGTGPASSTTRATGTTAGPATATGQSTGSPTSSGSDPFPTDSLSTIAVTPTSARAAEGDASTAGASTPITSSLSPSVRTSGEDVRQPSPPASTGTTSHPRTPMSGPTDTGNAGPACEYEHGLTGDVWSIPSQPLVVPAHLGIDHFASFPMELPRRIILGWSPPGICTACGEGRRPVSERVTPGIYRRTDNGWPLSNTQRKGDGPSGNGLNVQPTTITGYACACPQPDAPVRPALIVDPFGGTGTTALVAAMLGRTGVSVDRSADYCRLARWRVSDPAERAKALQVPKPPSVPDGQASLFDDLPA